MGYYSDTGLVLTKNGIQELQSRLADRNLDEKTKKEVEELFNHAEHHVDPHTQSQAWLWSDIKWYSGDPEYFPEIDFIDKLLLSLDVNDYRFVRIGEDYDDTEMCGNLEENPFVLELVRGIRLGSPT